MDVDRHIRIVLASDRMSVSIALQPGIPPGLLTVDIVVALLLARGVAACEDLEREVRVLLGRYGAGLSAVEHVVLRGEPAIAGEDGRFELVGSAHPRTPELRGDERLDHYSQTSVRVVRPGEHIATLHAPTPGVDGHDVMGQAVPAKPGAPVRITVDDTVRVEADGRAIANASGTLRFTGSALRVAQLLDVQGFVDFETGNIAFPGDVRVAEGVRDCFVVDAQGTVEVAGLVEAASVSAGIDVVLHRGVAGRGKGVVRAARDLHTRYIEHATCTVGRDLFVLGVIRESAVEVSGQLHARSCSVMGGTLFVGAGGEVAQLGAEAGSSTEIMIGWLPEAQRAARKLLDELTQSTREVQHLQSELAQRRSAGRRLSPRQAEEITELQFELARASENCSKTRGCVDRLAASMIERTRTRLAVNRGIYPGVTVCIGPWRCEIRELVHGPGHLGLDSHGQPCFVRSGVTVPLGPTGLAKLSADDRYQAVAALLRTVAASPGQHPGEPRGASAA